MTYQTVNPYDGQLLKTFDELTDNQLETALSTADTCFKSWRHRTFAERAAVAAKAAAIMRSHVDEYARLVTLEMGKRIEEARSEVALSADIIDYYAKNSERFLAPQDLKPTSGVAEVESVPFGVLFGVQPWNFPYYQLARFAAPNLMAGNVIMVKHAGSVPQCALAFEKLWLEAGAPAGAYTNLFISYDHARSHCRCCCRWRSSTSSSSTSPSARYRWSSTSGCCALRCPAWCSGTANCASWQVAHGVGEMPPQVRSERRQGGSMTHLLAGKP